MDDFLIRALLAGLMVSLITGPLGCLVVWRRMAYFGATLSHAALLGITLSWLLDWHPQIGMLIVGAILVLILLALERQRLLGLDTLLGILAHASLALGLVLVSLQGGLQIDLMSYLMGDILTVSKHDLLWIGVGAVVILSWLVWNWDALVISSIDTDLAKTSGIRVDLQEFSLLMMLSLMVAISIQIVGLLLIVSLLIIPAASARLFAQSPQQMAVAASLIGAVAVSIGLTASGQWDLPAGPAIVLAASTCFVALLILRGLRNA